MTVHVLASCRPSVGRVTHLSLGMAQLAPGGLSEQWVLRQCGDLHWALIGQALGQERAVFRAPDGRAAYAAFCTTSLHLPTSPGPLLGEAATITSTLSQVSETRTGSRHRLEAQGRVVAELAMISAFVSHDDSGSNTRIFGNPTLGMIACAPADHALIDLDHRARLAARRLRESGVRGTRLAPICPVPTLDFNAAGLLYFPTFSRLAEMAAYSHGTDLAAVSRREVTYLGNLNMGERIHPYLDRAEMTLTRDDGRPLALIRTCRAD